MDEGRDPVSDRIIGARLLPNRWVARKPPNIYWNGIRTYHIFDQNSMTIPDMVKLSIIMRSQEKPDNLGNRRDDAEEGEKDDRDAGRGDAIRFFDLPEQSDSEWRIHPDMKLLPLGFYIKMEKRNTIVK